MAEESQKIFLDALARKMVKEWFCLYSEIL